MPVLLQAALLGFVQGITEFVPVSSSGHLAAIPRLLGWAPLGKSFDVALHFGTLMALLAFYHEKILHALGALQHGPGSREGRLGWSVALATVPVGALGFLFEDAIDAHCSALPSVLACMGIFGLLLGLADRHAEARARLSQLTWRQVLLIGLCQAFALLPGASRSGCAITGGLLVGLTRAQAADFSFLLAVPVTAAAVALKAVYTPITPEAVVGALVSGLTGYLCIVAMTGMVRRSRYLPFAVYRVAVSAILLIGLAL